MFSRLLLDSLLQLPVRLAYASKVEIDFGDVEAGKNLCGVELLGLLKFSFRLRHKLGGAFAEVRLSEHEMHNGGARRQSGSSGEILNRGVEIVAADQLRGVGEEACVFRDRSLLGKAKQDCCSR